MKKFLLISALTIFILLLTLTGILFARPLLLFNPHTIAWVLHKTHVLEQWSWKEARMGHERKTWLHRNFYGDFKDFCFSYQGQVKTCLETVSWDIDILYKDGLKVTTNKPFTIVSSQTDVVPGKEEVKKEVSDPPDLWKYWKMLWKDYIPDVDVNFKKIVVHKKPDPLSFDLKIRKTKNLLSIDAMKFNLTADRQKIILKAPEKYPFPRDLGSTRPLYFKKFKLVAMPSKKGIPLDLTGSIETAEVIVKSYIQLPLVGDFTSLNFKKDLLLKTEGEVKLTGLKESLRDYAPAPYNRLPAPLNVMDGNVIFRMRTEDRNRTSILAKAILGVDLKSEDQVVNVDVKGDVPLDLRDFSRGIMKIGIDFKKLSLKLPRLSKKTSPPQFKPDGRFKTGEELAKKENEKTTPLKIHLSALNEEALHVESNLLDEPLRLNFDIFINDGEIKTGFMKALPLKTKVFKRPVHVEDLVVNFKAPLSPVINSTIIFPLPEYKVKLEIEGPVEQPRYAFSSKPPLPESDIYAVLLFGRPMDQLGTEDKTSASRTNQILAQGLLSLSTLYFLAGSPVEYVGYDPESKTASAQIGLGSKSSLRVGGGREGVNSTAVRRSLGKGWYLDTSVQDTSTTINSSRAQNYGVLLERIIAY